MNTGKLRWYYQMIHHDIWDYDSTNATILFDRGSVKGIAHAGQDGLGVRVRSPDRQAAPRDHGAEGAAGAPLEHLSDAAVSPNGDKFTEQCPQKSDFGGKWPKAPDGKPYKRIGCIFAPYDDTGYTLTRPSALGGANWPPSAYSPDTGYMYICSKDSVRDASSRSRPQKQKLAALGDFFQLDEGFLAGPDTQPGARGSTAGSSR